ncbi:MAG: SDR family oxidoreductase [Armatimonadetes bacterium]|nr:SDR family oxidoreductase [Armatimonadota bacterium]
MKTIVLGGAGFVGSHLCDALIAQGNEVICVDNFLTGRRDNVAHLRDHPRFRFVQRDITEPLALEGEAVFHLASPASPVGYRKNSIQTLRVNSIGTMNALEMARQAGARFLLASTSEIYGDPQVHPQPETYWGNVDPTGLRACYDEGKRFGEAATMEWQRVHGVDARIVRIFNTYGPRNDPQDGRVVPNFITQALRGEPITVYGDGLQTRSFAYVSDLVEGLLAAMFTEGTAGEVFNLGNPDECTILEFARLVKKVTESRSEIVFRPLRFADDPARRRPDITRARTRLGWEPRVPLEEGLRHTVAWYREILGAGVGG